MKRCGYQDGNNQCYLPDEHLSSHVYWYPATPVEMVYAALYKSEENCLELAHARDGLARELRRILRMWQHDDPDNIPPYKTGEWGMFDVTAQDIHRLLSTLKKFG